MPVVLVYVSSQPASQSRVLGFSSEEIRLPEPSPAGRGAEGEGGGWVKQNNEPSMFCVVYCFISRFARARVSLNKRRALLAVSWRPTVPYLRAAIRR